MCVCLCGQNLYTLRFGTMQDNVMETMKLRTEPHLDFKSQDVWKAVLKGLEELSIQALV